IQARYALKIKALSQQAKIDPSTARRIIDQRSKHFRSRNGWNSYQAWVKHKARETAEQTEGPAPTEGPAATEGSAAAPPANDIDEPTAPASAAKQDVGAAYEALTPANKQAIDKWATKRLDEKPARDTQKEFSAACRDVMTRIGHLQLRYGITAVAFLSHSQEGIDPFLGYSDQAGVALASALNRLKTGTTGDDVSRMFDRAVKLKVWEDERNAREMDGPLVVCRLNPTQRLARDLILRLHSAVSAALVGGSAALTKWVKATSGGTRLRYKDLFSMVAETGCYVEGWPEEATGLLKDDVVMEQARDANTASTGAGIVKVWSGSLHNTSVWKEEPMEALRKALRENNLRARQITAPEDPFTDMDE
ncbi:unnamed protein product, partial [Tilletia laevis]